MINDFSIADFAENLMKEGKIPPVPTSIGGEKITGPDLRKIEPIRKDELDLIFERSFKLKTPQKIIKSVQKVVEKKEEKLTVEQATLKLLALIKEAQQLITEMTDCGMIGVNQASGGFKKKKKIDKKKFTKINLAKLTRKR